MNVLTRFLDEIEYLACRVVDYKISSFVWLASLYTLTIVFVGLEASAITAELGRGHYLHSFASVVLGVVPTIFARYVLGQAGYHIINVHMEEWFA